MTETDQTRTEPSRAVTTEPSRTETKKAAPTPTTERIPVLDVLRGIALYGVLLANTVHWFSARAFMPRAEVLAQTDRADDVFLLLHNIFVEGKAMTLLTFLFGLGFSLQLQRAEASGHRLLPTYVR